jgi:hypothetical protein
MFVYNLIFAIFFIGSDGLKHANLKVILCMISCVLLAVMLTGCAIIPADISELESPPKLTNEQQAIENALESKVGDKFTLKYPLEGDYRSAFVLKDINNDGTQEAFAFYSPSNGNAGPHIAFLDKVKGKWKDISDIGSEGNEIDSIAFGDFNGDGVDEIAVGWRSFNTTDLTLMVYSLIGNSFVKTNLGSFTEMQMLDMDGDGNPDILLIKLFSDEKVATARLISYRGGKLGVVAQAPLDSTVTSYAGVYTTKLDAHTNGVLIDGYKSTHSMVTELVYYKDGKLISPFYSQATHTVSLTMRPMTYQCLDIENNGVFEIPMPVSLPYVPDKANDNKNWLVNWSVFDGKNGITPKLSCIMNYAENYYFIYPKKWGNQVTVNKQAGNNSWNFCEWDSNSNSYGRTLFSIYVYSDDVWNNMTNKDSLYEIVEKNGTVYSATIPQPEKADPLCISIQEIIDNFHLID